MESKDIRVEIRFKNNLLYKKIFEKYESVAHFCRKNNCTGPVVGKYLNLKTSPLAKTRSQGSLEVFGYFIKWSAVKIAEALDCHVFDIFPQQLWDIEGKKYHLEIDSQQFISYNDKLLIENIVDCSPLDINKDNISRVLATLTPREESVIRQRFGFDGCEMALNDIGEIEGVTKERIRQIEVKALRKLRGPSRAKFLTLDDTE